MDKITVGDLSSAETMRDVVGFYQKLNQQSEPLIRIEDYYGMGPAWLAWSHANTVAILKDPRFIKDMRKFATEQNQPATTEEEPSMKEQFELTMNMPNMLEVDPPDHTRLRRLTAKTFTPWMIENLRPRIEEITNKLLDTVQSKGQMDLITDFAFPLPITVISEMLGVPDMDHDQIRDWTHTIMTANADPSLAAESNKVFNELNQYIKGLIEEKRNNPGEDVISGLVSSYDEGDKLSEPELLSTIGLLIVAGHETTTNLLGNGMLALLQHPEQLQLLKDNPALLPSAVEELLRFAGPILYSYRFAGEDLTMHGKEIRKGEMMLFTLATANLDSQKFPNPETLDLTRVENEHLAFGKGIHHCLGAPLARLEVQIAIDALFKRMPNLRLAVEPDQLTYNPSAIRSLTSLPLVF